MEAPETSFTDFKGPFRSLLKFKHLDRFPTALKSFIIDSADYFLIFFLVGGKKDMDRVNM